MTREISGNNLDTASSFSKSERRELDLCSQTTVYINAGGEGSRMRSLIGGERVTKALVDLPDGEPIIDHYLRYYLGQNFRNVIVGAGNHFNVRDYVSSCPEWGSQVITAVTDVQEGNGGDMIKAIRESSEVGKKVLVANVDTLADINFAEVLKYHEDKKGLGTIVLTARPGVPNQGSYLVREDGLVLYSAETGSGNTMDNPEEFAYSASSTGVVVLDSDYIRQFPWQPGSGPMNFYKDFLGRMISEGTLWAFNNGNNFFREIGTAEDFRAISGHLNRIKRILEQRASKK